MHNKLLFTIAVSLGVWLFAQPSFLQAVCWQADTNVSANQVRKAIRKGGEYLLSVSYTHLTLPTKRIV